MVAVLFPSHFTNSIFPSYQIESWPQGTLEAQVNVIVHSLLEVP